MRILQMVPALEAGGVETGTIDIARELKKRRHDVFVMSSGGPLVKELVKAGIPHITHPIHAKSLFSLLLVKTVADFIRKERIDIVHARSRIPAWIGYLAARQTDAAFVTTCHGYYSQHFMSRIMGWGKEVIAISQIIGRHMIDNFGVPPERIHLIHRGVDLSKYEFQAEKYLRRDKSKPFVISNIGRITPIKGHTHFLKAIHIAKQQIPSLEAWIVGGPDRGKEKYLDELKALVSKLGLEKEVKFLGRREDVPEILAKTHVLTLTTNVPEGFGRVLIEAGASGTAVVSTRVGGVVEIVEDGKNGLLVPVDDETSLAQAFTGLYADAGKAQGFADALRRKVEREFSHETMVDKTVAVYEKARQGKKVLVLKFGSLGDLVLAVPSLRMIRKKFAGARITLVLDAKWYGLMKMCPYVDEIVTIDRGRKKGEWARLLKLAKRLRSEQFDLSIDLQNNKKSHLLAFLSNVPKRAGYSRGWTGKLITNDAGFDVPMPPVEHQFQVLKSVGITDFSGDLEWWIPEDDRKWVERLLQDAWINPGQKLIGFALSASAQWATKNWPIEKYVELAKKLGSRFNVRIFLLGDAHAEPLAYAFEKEGLPYVTNLVGKTSLRELAALISRLDLLVTGDTAPMHLAAATGTKFVALFGPTDPKRHVPPAKHFTVLKKDVPCSPCYSGKCKVAEFVCMPTITEDEVFKAAKDLLAFQKEPVPAL